MTGSPKAVAPHEVTGSHKVTGSHEAVALHEAVASHEVTASHLLALWQLQKASDAEIVKTLQALSFTDRASMLASIYQFSVSSNCRKYKLPWHVYVHQVLAIHRNKTCSGDTSLFIGCRGCMQTKMSHVSPKRRKGTIVPGSVECMVGDDLQKYCVSSKTHTKRSVSDVIGEHLCKTQPLSSTSLIGSVVICTGRAYTICIQCGVVTEMQLSYVWAPVCTLCSQKTIPCGGNKCAVCNQSVRLTANNPASEHRLFYDNTHNALSWEVMCSNCRNNMMRMAKEDDEQVWPPSKQDVQEFNTRRYIANEKRHIKYCSGKQ